MEEHICNVGDLLIIRGHKFRISRYARLGDFEPQLQVEYEGEVSDDKS